MSNTKIISDSDLTDIIMNDIKEMDSDSFAFLVEQMYDVKAEVEDGVVEITPTNGLSVKTIFGQNFKMFTDE